MANVDLVVTSDTAIAHLAGALGKPVYLALKHVPDWRWLMIREDCPWYPTMRLFRQAEEGDWKSVIERIASRVEACFTKRDYSMEKPNQGRIAPAIPGAVGELIDKITILEIKEKHVSEAAKLDNIRFELTVLRQLRAECAYGGEQLKQLEAELKAANYLLWNAEDLLREHEKKGDFGSGFVALARQVYKTNDLRASLKRKINILLNSVIVEEKAY